MIDFRNTNELTIEKKDVVTLFIDGKLAWENAKGGDWLCFTAEQADSTVHLDKVGDPDAISLETSTDGSNWTDYTLSGNTGTTLTLANVGDKVYMRAKGENARISKTDFDYYKFSMTGKIAASGNIQKLLKADGSRTDAPAFCYWSMFNGCSSLTTAPTLPATTIEGGCYGKMFYNCSSLTTAPELPVTPIATRCYRGMFNGCSSLTTAPKLPATTIGGFLIGLCYSSMFNSCTSLSSIDVSFTDWSSSGNPTNNWLNNVAASGTFTCPAELSDIRDASHIPTGWTVKRHEYTYVKYTDASGLSDWEGDIVGQLTTSSIPNLASVKEVELGSHVTDIANRVFWNKTSITSVKIPGTVTSVGQMLFTNCTNLSSVTIGNGATTIGISMFQGCSSLTSLEIPNTVTHIGVRAFSNCTGLTSMTIPKNVKVVESYAFEQCSNLMNVTFIAKPKADVQRMATYYEWRLPSGCVLHCADGDITIS